MADTEAPVEVREGPVELAVGPELWQRVFAVAPLVLVGTKEGDGYNFAPKHMAMPLGCATSPRGSCSRQLQLCPPCCSLPAVQALRFRRRSCATRCRWVHMTR